MVFYEFHKKHFKVVRPPTLLNRLSYEIGYIGFIFFIICVILLKITKLKFLGNFLIVYLMCYFIVMTIMELFLMHQTNTFFAGGSFLRRVEYKVGYNFVRIVLIVLLIVFVYYLFLILKNIK